MLGALVLIVALPGQHHPNDMDARRRRLQREAAVMFVGPSARNLVETYDAAAGALLNCTAQCGRKLAAWEGICLMPRPNDLLLLIAHRGCGTAVAEWAMLHERELQDQDCFNLFASDRVLEYALNLRSLEKDAEAIRAASAKAQVTTGTFGVLAKLGSDWRNWGLAVAGVIVVVVLISSRKRAAPAVA